jgi:hypothetical protein
MPVNWMDVTGVSFNTLLLLERVQLGWFAGWAPEDELAIALRANPVVEWYKRLAVRPDGKKKPGFCQKPGF